MDEEALQNIEEADADYSCASAGGAVSRGVLGPFGFLVLADESLAELTAVYFYIGKGIDGRAKTHFCADQLRFALILTDATFKFPASNFFSEKC